jgi:hypothetical protein
MRDVDRDGLTCGRKCESEIPSQTKKSKGQLFHRKATSGSSIKTIE